MPQKPTNIRTGSAGTVDKLTSRSSLTLKMRRLAMVSLASLTLVLVTSSLPGGQDGPSAAAAAEKHAILVRVKNPNCPACLKTLKSYLLAMPGVKAVWLPPARDKAPTVDVIVIVTSEALRPRIIERIKAHDLQIIPTTKKP